jgi:DNA-binding CsgD family transcriptional regulator
VPERVVLGRTQERERLGAAIRRIVDGPRAMTIAGEPGIGKTALWNVALDDAQGPGGPPSLSVLRARAVQAERSLSNVILTDLFAPVAPHALPDLPGPQAVALAAALLLDDDDADSGASDPRAVGTAILGVVHRITQRGPLLLAIDDVQWVDAASAAALDFALRRAVAASLPVGLLVTERTPRERTVIDDADLAGHFGDDAERLDLGPISLGVLHRIIRDRTGTALTRPQLLRLDEASGGNPLLAIEIGRELARVERWPLPGEPLPVPADIRQLVAARLERLSPAAVDALFVAAASVAPTLATIATVLERPTADVIAELDRAEAAGLLTRDGDDPIRFAHPTFEAAALAAPAPERRQALRRRLAQLATSDEDRGRHTALIAAGPDAQAAATLDAAAAAARRRGAPGVAAAWADIAADLTPPDDVERRGRRAFRAARWWVDAGEVARGRKALERLVTIAPAGDLRAEVRAALAQVVGWEDGPEAMLVVAQAALAEARDPEVRARILLRMATGADHQAATARSELADAAVAALRGMTEREPDADLLACALLQSAAFRFDAGLADDQASVDAAIALLADAPRPTADSDESAESHRAHALAWEWSDDHDRIDAALEGALRDLERARSRGLDRPLPIVETEVSLLLVRAGRWDDAAAHAQAALDAADLAGNPEGRRAALGGLAGVALVRGDLEAAAALVREAEPPGTPSDWLTIRHRAIEGGCALMRGDAGRAVAILGPLLDEQVALGRGETLQYRFAGDLAEAALAAGDLARARDTVAVLAESVVRRPRPWVRVVAARSEALLAAADGDLDRADLAIRTALEYGAELAMPLELARTELAAGRIARRRKQRRLAAQHLERAVAGFTALGAAAWQAVAEAEVARLGRRQVSSDDLTETELQVARLAAAGLTNRAVGEAAFLTAKSVEGVLARVYSKLGIRSRAELGAWLAATSGGESMVRQDGIPPFRDGEVAD